MSNGVDTTVAVFAHNEERNIVRCLESLPAAGCDAATNIIVLVNGCTDRTLEVVNDYARTRENITPLSINIGDKANAWNVFVYEHSLPTGVAVFVDGDVVPAPESIKILKETLDNDPTALISSALPRSGRNRDAQVESILAERGVYGNLYAVRAEFLARIRSRNIRMPVGFVREDGLIAAMAKWDLDSRNGPWVDERVAPAPGAGFSFQPVPLWKPSAWRQYLRRRVRYSTGYFEIIMLRQILKTGGPERLPATVEEMYAMFPAPRLSWRGLNTVFDWMAKREIEMRTSHPPSRT